MDEATQFTEWQFRVLTASLRGANPFPKRLYLTCNPGGIGHAWVRRLFVQRRYEPNENPADYCFISATVYDNRILLQNDPGYLENLRALPPEKRAAWLDGCWDVPEGRFFDEFSYSAHVCPPFTPPPHWRRYFAMDYGLDMLAGLWAAMDEQGRLHIYREIFSPNLLMSQAAAAIRAAEANDAPVQRFAPPDLWNRRQDTGRSVYEAFCEAGLPLTKVRSDRISGWLNVKEWLGGTDSPPRLQIAANCPHLIESLQNLLCDPRSPGDASTQPHIFTHCADALRYLISGRPTATACASRQTDFTRNEHKNFITYGRCF